MKKFYLSFFFLFSFSLFAQNDLLLGQWNLHYIEVDGVQQYSTVPNSDNIINFNEDYSISGAVCDNGYGGNYQVINESQISITDFSALAGSCNFAIESNLFLNPYLWIVLSNSTIDDVFNYSISGSGNDETLVLTNSENNSAVYGRSPLPENKLPGTWYLHKIVKNDVEEINTFNPNFRINFTLTPDISGVYYEGEAICNNYFGSYNLDGVDAVVFEYFGFTLSFCDTEGYPLEASYFSFFQQAQSEPQQLNYNVTGSGNDETLTLTNADNGDYVQFGRQTLSTTDTALNKSIIKLKENPVKEQLEIVVENSGFNQMLYAIYSVDGKLIFNTGILENNIINLNNLNSGLYFIKIQTDDNQTQTLKFIKE